MINTGGRVVAHAVVNPNAEVGNVTGWTVEAGHTIWTVDTVATLPMFAGDYCFYGGAGVALSGMYQNITLDAALPEELDTGTSLLRFDCAQQSHDNFDGLAVEFRFRDASNALLNTVTSTQESVFPGYLTSGTWRLRTFDALIPTGTRSVDLALLSTRIDGSNNNAYVDNITLHTIVENTISAPIVAPLTSAAVVVADLSDAELFDMTLAQDMTVNLTGGSDGQQVVFRFRQDVTGTRVVTWGTMCRGSADLTLPTLSVIPYKLDYIAFRYNEADTAYDCVAVNLGFN